MTPVEKAAWYRRGYAEGLRDKHDFDVARLLEERDQARAAVDMERILRRTAESRLEVLKSEVDALRAHVDAIGRKEAA